MAAAATAAVAAAGAAAAQQQESVRGRLQGPYSRAVDMLRAASHSYRCCCMLCCTPLIQVRRVILQALMLVSACFQPPDA
jgi:hypothetical protein